MDFYADIEEDGYHIFSLKKAKVPGFYPNKFPDYPGVRLEDLCIGDSITIRAFFPVGTGESLRVDGGYIDLEIELIDTDHVFGVIRTKLPEEFALSSGESIELWEDEILYKNEELGHA